MKTLLFSLSLLTIASIAYAQRGTSPYVFPAFVKASVLQKGGGATGAEMNYNTLTQEMLFMQNGEKLVMDQASNIDTIYLQDKKFIPVGKVYYEKLTDTKIALYQQHWNKLTQHGKAVDSDHESHDSMTATYGFKAASGQAASKYDLKIGDGYELKSEDAFYLQKGKSFYQVEGLKNILKHFPGKEPGVNAYVKDKNLDLTKADDMAKLIVFCNLP